MKFIGAEPFFSVDKLFAELNTYDREYTVHIFGTVYYLFFTEKKLPTPGAENLRCSGCWQQAMFLVMWVSLLAT